MVVKNKQMGIFFFLTKKNKRLLAAAKGGGGRQGFDCVPPLSTAALGRLAPQPPSKKASWRSNPRRPEDRAPVMCHCDSIYDSYRSLRVPPRLQPCEWRCVEKEGLWKQPGVIMHFQVPADGGRSGGTSRVHALAYRWRRRVCTRQHPPVD